MLVRTLTLLLLCASAATADDRRSWPPFETGRLGLDLDLGDPLDRVVLASEIAFFQGRGWTLGVGTSIGMEEIGGEAMTDLSAVLPFLGALVTFVTLPIWSGRDGDYRSWGFAPMFVAQLPAARLDLHLPGGFQVGAGLHGRLIDTNALFRKDAGEGDSGWLFAPGPRVGFTWRKWRATLNWGRRHWLREDRRWALDGEELRLRVDFAESFLK